MTMILNEYPSIKVIHVIKDNELVIKAHRADILQTQEFPIGCIFKSFLSVLTGIAIKEKRINSIEDRILDYIGCKSISDKNWYELRIKHVLSKTTSLIWPEPNEQLPINIDDILKLNFENPPGRHFKYKPDPQIIVCLLENIYQCNIVDLFKRKLVNCFTNKNFIWNSNNIQNMQVQVDMLDELGQLMLNRGTINGNNVFSEQYYNQCIVRYSSGGFPENTAYGLGWWLNTIHNDPVFYAAGFGGQLVLVMPSRNISLSIISDMDRPHPEYIRLAEQLCQ